MEQNRQHTASGSSRLTEDISDARMVIQARTPFFGTLLFACRIRESQAYPTAATDGRDIFLNVDFVASLDFEEFLGLLLHELLHAALLHQQRRGARDPVLFNVAADMVVNEMISEQGFTLPPGPVRIPNARPEWKERSVEELYELLQREKDRQAGKGQEGKHSGAGSTGAGHASEDQRGGLTLDEAWQDLVQGADATSRDGEELEHTWRQALRRAGEVQRLSGQGTLPAGLQRYVDRVLSPQVDWRTALWRFLVRTPVDFEQFDRRLLYRGLYLETLEAESVQLYLAIDTSGSISQDDLSLFMGELQGILSSYPHIDVQLYYADADIYGPYALSRADLANIPEPEGGGGTSFVPFFNAVEDDVQLTSTPVAVYLTDGYGDFPDVPSFPTLWVTTPGSLPEDEYPFGQVIQLRKQP